MQMKEKEIYSQLYKIVEQNIMSQAKIWNFQSRFFCIL